MTYKENIFGFFPAHLKYYMLGKKQFQKPTLSSPVSKLLKTAFLTRLVGLNGTLILGLY